MRRFASLLTFPVLLVAVVALFVALPYEAQKAYGRIAADVWRAALANPAMVLVGGLLLLLAGAGLIYRAGYISGINAVYYETKAKNEADRERRLK